MEKYPERRSDRNAWKQLEEPRGANNGQDRQVEEGVAPTAHVPLLRRFRAVMSEET